MLMVHRSSAATTALGLLLACVGSSLIPASRAASVTVVISQIYGGGGNAGAPLTNDFVELHNMSDVAVSVDGWSIQYASATGSGNFGAASNQITELTGTIAPHGYLLVQEAGGANGVPLPAPDVTDATPIALASGAGKVALVNTTTPLGCNGSVTQPCSAAALATIVDLVGYGSANFFEGAGAAPAPSNDTAVLRADGDDADAEAGDRESDDNSLDFMTGTPSPRNGAFTPPPPPASGCDVAPSHEISAVQGFGASTPLAGQMVRVEGIVTGDFQGPGQLGGFYFQDDTPDGDPQTSDGLFAFTSAAFADVEVGQRVRVTGRAVEFNGLTELSPVAVVDVCGSGTIAPISYDLPRPPGETFERLENMLVTFPGELTATEHVNLGRFGEITVSSGGRLFQPTDRVAPGAEAAALLDLNNRRRLLIDDGSSRQNPTAVPFVAPGEALRIGDTTSDITGVLTFGFGEYRLEPTVPIEFTRTNPRTNAPAPVGGDIRVASFNTLNYFTTLTSVNRGARGADSLQEFLRQQAKEVAAIRGLNADVIALMEVENNGTAAIGSLVSALNAAAGAGSYASIPDLALNEPNEFGGTFGTDAIKVAIVYRPSAVTPVGDAQSSSDPVFERPPLVQVFQRAGGGESFTLAVNHFKSKNCDGASGADRDQGDGQSCFNARRVAQASALTSVLAALGSSNVLIVGDLNSYTEEDPVHALEDTGYIGLSKVHVADADRYSYVFDGHSGELDHALAAADLIDNVTGAAVWHINSDEASILDYNTETNPPALYAPDAYRASDHDPIVVGLTLNGAPTVDAGGPYTVVEGRRIAVNASGTDPEAGALSYDWDLNGDGTFETPGRCAILLTAGLYAPVTLSIAVRVTDVAGLSAIGGAEVAVISRPRPRHGRPIPTPNPQRCRGTHSSP